MEIKKFLWLNSGLWASFACIDKWKSPLFFVVEAAAIFVGSCVAFLGCSSPLKNKTKLGNIFFAEFGVFYAKYKKYVGCCNFNRGDKH